jgi:hypothetical protein
MVRQQQREEDMRLLLAATGVGLSLAIMLPTSAKAQCVSRSHLSGTWLSDDGGTYHVRRNGTDVWWMGQSGDGGRSWTNVFKGHWDSQTNLITGEFSDVINSTQINFGPLTLKLDGTLEHLNGFEKVSGGFGGSRWFFHCADN